MLILVASVTLLVQKMDFVLFDSSDGMFAFVTYQLPIGTPLSETIKKTKEIEAIIQELNMDNSPATICMWSAFIFNFFFNAGSFFWVELLVNY